MNSSPLRNPHGAFWMPMLGPLLLLVPVIRADDSLAQPSRLATAKDKARLSQAIGLTAKLNRTGFKPLEPISLTVLARNVSSHPIRIPSIGYAPEVYYRMFHVRVFDAKGNILPKTRFHEVDVRYGGLPVGLSNGSAGVLFPPGREMSGEVIANLVYDMTSPGDYTILIEFPTGEVRQIDGQAVPVVAQSEAIHVRVIAEPPSLPALRGN